MASKISSTPKRKELSPRQMKLIKARAQGKTYAQAATEAGYSPKHAAQNGYPPFSQIRGRGPNRNTSLGIRFRLRPETRSSPINGGPWSDAETRVGTRYTVLSQITSVYAALHPHWQF